MHFGILELGHIALDELRLLHNDCQQNGWY